MNPRTCFQKRALLSLIRALALSIPLLVAPLSLWAATMNVYTQRNLVSDGFVRAEQTDPNLVNAWGLVFNPDSAVWISDTGSGLSTLYKGPGNIVPLVVKIPGGSPTGIVYNGSSGFTVSKAGNTGASRFIFSTETGRISAWNYGVDPANAITMVDNSAKTGAVYKGLAIIATGRVQKIYATDFHNGRIDVFDKNFHSVALSSRAFTDPRLPAGYAPFGIQNIAGKLYVTYAKQDATKHDNVDGAGMGFVDIYNASGKLMRRLVSHGRLNAPWGLAKAPANFGKFSNSLLVANFGDGTIDAYDIASGKFRGQLMRTDHHPLKIDGIWGICFGNGKSNQPTNALYFTAGPQDEKHGLYGRIDPQG
jgi:uncharacterized protein (TIGR03118 family)